MPDAITSLLSRVDGSAGRTKENRRAPPNRVEFWPADEMNNVLDWVARASQWLGLSDGSTPDSLFEKLLSVSGYRGSRTVAWDDFLFGTVAATGAPYIATLVGGSTAALASLGGSGDGAGHLALTAAAAGGASVRVHTDDTIVGACSPDTRVRFKTPAGIADAELRVGLENAALTNYARLAVKAGTVYLQAKSVSGGGTADAATAVVLAADTWYDARVRVTSGRVDYYLADALIGSVTTATQVPSGTGESLGVFSAHVVRNANGPHKMHVDRYETGLARR